MNPFHTLLTAGAGRLPVLAALFLFIPLCAIAQDHEYPFVFYPLDGDTTVEYLFDWYEVEPDGLMRRDQQLWGKQAPALVGTIRPELHPEGTTIHLRASSLDGVLLDEHLLIVHDTTFSHFAYAQTPFFFECQHEYKPGGTVFDTGYMFEVEDDTIRMEFFNLTEEKVRFEHSKLFFDEAREAYEMQGISEGRSDRTVLSFPVVPDTNRIEMHFFEFITRDQDTLSFVASAIGAVDGYTHVHMPSRSEGDILLGRVLPAAPPR